MIADGVRQKLRFARRRLDEFREVMRTGRLDRPDDRHQPTQEFFVHLVGAVEYLAQYLNEHMSLKLAPDSVTPKKVLSALAKSDRPGLAESFGKLWMDPRAVAMPSDPYSERGLVYRAINYRHEVVHRNANPFHFYMSKPRSSYFWLDPRNHALGQSRMDAQDDLAAMLDVVERLLEEVLRKTPTVG
jgi:hypothetical protein